MPGATPGAAERQSTPELQSGPKGPTSEAGPNTPVVDPGLLSNLQEGKDVPEAFEQFAEQGFIAGPPVLTTEAPNSNPKGLTPDEIKDLANKSRTFLRDHPNEDEGPFQSAMYQQADLMIGRADLPPEIGRRFDAHGIAKGGHGDQLTALNRLLTEGIDPTRPFHSLPLRMTDAEESGAAGAFGAAGPYDNGNFIVISSPDGSLRDGIGAVLVNEAFYDAIPTLQARFPNVKFIKASEMTEGTNALLTESAAAGISPDAVNTTTQAGDGAGPETPTENATPQGPAKRSDAEGKAILDKALESAQTRINENPGILPEDALKIQREEYEVARKTFAEVNGYEPVLFSHTGTEWVRDVDIAEESSAQESSAQGSTAEEIAKRVDALLRAREEKKALENESPTDRLIKLSVERDELERRLKSAKANNLSAEEVAGLKQELVDIKVKQKEAEKADGRSIDQRFSEAGIIRNNAQAQLDRARDSGNPGNIALAKERYDNVSAYYNYLLWERRKGLPKKILLALLSFLPLQIIFDIKNELQGGLKGSQPQNQ